MTIPLRPLSMSVATWQSDLSLTDSKCVLVVGFVQRFMNSQFYWMTTLLQHQIKEEKLLLWMLRFRVLVSVFESVLSKLLTHEKSNMVFLTDMSYCILFTFSVMLADTPISSLVLLQM